MVEMKGTYNRTSADNYEEFLTALGVSWPLRLMATNSAVLLVLNINKFAQHRIALPANTGYLSKCRIVYIGIGWSSDKCC